MTSTEYQNTEPADSSSACNGPYNTTPSSDSIRINRFLTNAQCNQNNYYSNQNIYFESKLTSAPNGTVSAKGPGIDPCFQGVGVYNSSTSISTNSNS